MQRWKRLDETGRRTADDALKDRRVLVPEDVWGGGGAAPFMQHTEVQNVKNCLPLLPE